ncbi:FAD-binding oxidoreductase [Cupriavidus pauculus]|uniref:FAD-binding oxidoreductase n=1 Tax=Cupriavidus pauculus TaxID=82633 RepID=UPI001EE2382D|nr:FAD-binding oxidoreductase [Cupriavidus pauculus]
MAVEPAIPGNIVDNPRRRRVLRAGGFAAASIAGVSHAAESFVVDDVSKLDRVHVARIVRPGSSQEVRELLRRSTGPVSIGGGCFSMGGQIAATGSLHLDMRGMNGVVWLDVSRRRIRVQAGMTWRELQDVIDPHDLAVKIMQNYSNFSIGGSVSVNCHGRYVGAGPVVNSIRALQVAFADGRIMELSREINPDIFRAVAGGYGGLGVITEVELELAENCVIARQCERVALADYPAFFREKILSNPHILLHNADLAPPSFDRPLAVTWEVSEKKLTESKRLVPRGLNYAREQNLIWALTELPATHWLRERYADDALLNTEAVVRRNYEASLDTASLEPRTRVFSTYLLQEYFVPTQAFLPFARKMATVLKQYNVPALNISIRHSPADTTALLAWAQTEVFSFVLYYKQRSNEEADEASRRWTSRLIDTAISAGGRYYLPYRLHASPDQFHRAYPQVAEFFQIKNKVDPGNRFRNMLWDKYLPCAK